ncbi:MAG TPA: hypothetical protein VNZ57_11120 [Longimicrobiales bacterium]|nr:hypothetical protein [Longimicrobiales bacterium]
MDAASPELQVRLALFGYPPTAARLIAHRRSKTACRGTALLILIGSWIVAPLTFFIPPHLEWPIAILLGGAYLARRAWTRDLVVVEFSGTCVKCRANIGIRAGATLAIPHTLTCARCGHTLVLEYGEAPETTGSVEVGNGPIPAPGAPPEPDDTRPPGRLHPPRNSSWSPAGSGWVD